MNTPGAATKEFFQLAEGPVWDAARHRLLWVDILSGTVLEVLHDGEIEVNLRHQFDGMVGAVTVADDGAYSSLPRAPYAASAGRQP